MLTPMILGDLAVWDEYEFKRRSRQLDLLASGDFSPIKDEIALAFPNSNLPVRAIPFVQRYVAELSGLYDRPVVRRFRGASTAAWQKLAAVYDESNLNAALSDVEQALLVQSTVLVVVLPDGLGRVSLLQLLPWQVDRVDVSDPLRAADPRNWTKVSAEVPASTVGGQVINGRMELTTTHAWRMVGSTKVGIYNEDCTHPFGRVPVVAVRRTSPAPGRWCAPVNEAVLNLQVSLSLQAADDENIVRHCAFPQKVIRNASPSQMVEEMTIGPDKVIALVRSGDPTAPAPELAVVQGQVPVAELVSFAEHKIRLYCAMLGLDPSSFLRVNTAVTASARLFAAQDRKALSDRLQPSLRRMETEIARLVAEVLGQRELMPMPAGLSVDVQWHKPEPPADPRADAEANRARIALGLDSRSAIVARERGIGPSAAAALVVRNVAEDRALAPQDPNGQQADAPAADSEETTEEATAVDAAAEPLNGAQVTAVLDIVQQVSAGLMSAATAVDLIGLAFPMMAAADVASLVAKAAAHKLPAPAPPAQAPANA